MAQRLPNPPPGFEELPIRDQLEYIGNLWALVVEREADVPAPPEHLDELRARLDEHDANPDDVIPWDQAHASIRAGLGSRKQ